MITLVFILILTAMIPLKEKAVVEAKVPRNYGEWFQNIKNILDKNPNKQIIYKRKNTNTNTRKQNRGCGHNDLHPFFYALYLSTGHFQKREQRRENRENK